MNSSIVVTGKWQWVGASGGGKWTRPQQAVRQMRVSEERAETYDVQRSRLKMRGRGDALTLRFESEPGRPFELLGWAVSYVGETDD